MSLCMWAGIFMPCYLILLKLKFFARSSVICMDDILCD